jgi:MFS family permease
MKPSFIVFLLGSFVSKVGDSLYTFAIPWISYELTKSATIMGSLFATSVLPIVVFGPFVGSFVDKFSKKKLMIAADIGRAILISFIPILHATNTLEIWHLYVITFLVTILSLLFDVSTVTIIPEISGGQFAKSNSAMQFITQSSGLLGPLIAGVLISSIGGYRTIWIDVFSFTATIFTVWKIISVNVGKNEQRQENIFKSMLQGFRWLKKDKLNFSFSLQAMIGNFGYSTAFAVLIYYLRTILHLNAERVGINLALLSIGGFIATIVTIPIERKIGRRNAIPILLTIGMFGFFLAMVPNVWFAPGIGFGIVSLCNVSWNIMVTTTRQESVPKDILGRILSFSRVVTRLAMPMGAMLGAFVSSNGSPVLVFLIAALSKFIEILIAVFWIRPLLTKTN